MGAGITRIQQMVVRIDIEQEYVDKGLSNIEKSLFRLVSKGRMSEDEAEAAINLISTGKKRVCIWC